ncbi:MAG TPA: hypothetical protein VI027_11920 [Rubrobacteraceae bacterium]
MIPVVVGLFGLAISSFLNVVIHRVALRMRDVKIGSMLGTLLGPCAVLRVFLGVFLGALVGGVLMATGKFRSRSALPFGVFLAVAGVFPLFLGQELWGSYLRLIEEA